MRCRRPLWSRPTATLPVPALTTIPGPSPNAPASAISISVVTMTCETRFSLRSAVRSSSRSVSRPAPAAPTTRTSPWSRPASDSAPRTTSMMVLADASARPGRTAAPGPSARPTIFPSRDTATAVLVPPTSAPISIRAITPLRTKGIAAHSSPGRSFGAGVRKVAEGNASEYGQCSTKRHVPGPREPPYWGEPAEATDGGQLLGEDDEKHHNDGNSDRPYDIAALRPGP